MKKAIFLFDYTGIMAKPWADAGYLCYCFDGQHDPGISQDGNIIKVGMFFQSHSIISMAMQIKSIVGDCDFLFGFPECTSTTNAGSKHWAKKLEFNPVMWEEAIALCDMVRVTGNLFDCRWGFENPVGKLSSLYRKPDFKFNPCDYAGYLPGDDVNPIYPEIYPPQDRYNKGTCIWHGNGFKKPKEKRIEPFFKENPGWKFCGGKSLKTKNIRSATPRGFAQAVFEANNA